MTEFGPVGGAGETSEGGNQPGTFGPKPESGLTVDDPALNVDSEFGSGVEEGIEQKLAG